MYIFVIVTESLEAETTRKGRSHAWKDTGDSHVATRTGWQGPTTESKK